MLACNDGGFRLVLIDNTIFKSFSFVRFTSTLSYFRVYIQVKIINLQESQNGYARNFR